MRVVSSVWLKHDLQSMLDALAQMAPREDRDGYYMQAVDAMRIMLGLISSGDAHSRTIWSVSRAQNRLEAGR